MTSPLTQDSDPGVVRSAPPLLQRQRHNLHLTESAGATQASRAHASDKYAFERTKLRTRRAHVNEVAALSMRNSHKRRGHTLRQTPHQFMEALERTKTLVDIIRQPTPFGAGPSDRLEHRLENLISEQEEEEEETESRKVKTLQLENKTFAVIHKIDGMHFYSIDIPRRGQPYALTVEVWSATDSNAVRLYVSRCDGKYLPVESITRNHNMSAPGVAPRSLRVSVLLGRPSAALVRWALTRETAGELVMTRTRAHTGACAQFGDSNASGV